MCTLRIVVCTFATVLARVFDAHRSARGKPECWLLARTLLRAESVLAVTF
jgi:hypothetical protein